MNANCEWRTIPYKKIYRRPRCSAVTSSDHTSSNDDVCVEKTAKRVRRAVVELKESEFCQNCLSKFREVLASGGMEKIKTIVCYGLGTPSGSSIPIQQLAFLLILKDYIITNFSDVSSDVTCSAYDPVFSSSDVALLQSKLASSF